VVRVRAADEGGEKQQGFQLKTSEKVGISALVLTAVIGGGAYVYGMEEIQVNAVPFTRGSPQPPTVVLEASSEPSSVEPGAGFQDLLYGDGLGGYGGASFGDVTGSLLWSVSLYYAS